MGKYDHGFLDAVQVNSGCEHRNSQVTENQPQPSAEAGDRRQSPELSHTVIINKSADIITAAEISKQTNTHISLCDIVTLNLLNLFSSSFV